MDNVIHEDINMASRTQHEVAPLRMLMCMT